MLRAICQAAGIALGAAIFLLTGLAQGITRAAKPDGPVVLNAIVHGVQYLERAAPATNGGLAGNGRSGVVEIGGIP